MSPEITIANRKIGHCHEPYLIAEIGSNHDKDIVRAKALIEVAHEAGCDAVKFQTFQGKDIPNLLLPADAYGRYPWNENFQYWHEVLDSLSLPYDWYPSLIDYAKERELDVIATPESLDAAEFLSTLDIAAFKLASMDLTYTDLLRHVGSLGKPVIISTGMSRTEEADSAMRVLRQSGASDIAVLHCISKYPSSCDDARLDLFLRLKESFCENVTGLSDHSAHNYAVATAVYLGASIVEKHITLDKKSKGPDHAFALEPRELCEMVRSARCGYRMRLGETSGPQRPDDASAQLYRRSIHVTKDLKAGDIIEESGIKCVRPGTGIQPAEKHKVLGKRLLQDVSPETLLTWDMLE